MNDFGINHAVVFVSPNLDSTSNGKLQVEMKYNYGRNLNQGVSAQQAQPMACRSFDKTKNYWRALISTHLGLDQVLRPALVVWVLLLSSISSAQMIVGDLSKVSDTTHLEFRGQNKWDYDLKKTGPQIYTLEIGEINEATLAQIATWSDSLVTSIKVGEPDTSKKRKIEFTVAEGVESFDYLTDEPSRLILDFYKQTPSSQEQAQNKAESASIEKPSLSELPKKKKTTKLGSSQRAEVDAEGYAKKNLKLNRKPAQEIGPVAGAAEGGDQALALIRGGSFDAADPQYQRLQIKDYEIRDEAIIAAKKKIYIEFPILKMPVSQTSQLETDLPEFAIRPRDDLENKQSRFMLELYQRQVKKTERTKDRLGAFFKVYTFFKSTYPESEYTEIVDHLAAHMHYIKWKQEKDIFDWSESQKIYRALIQKYPDSPLAERTAFWLANIQLDRGDGLATIQEFDLFLQKYPKSSYRDRALVGKMEGYLLLNKYDLALQEAKKMELEPENPNLKIEAYFRKGDVGFQKKDWSMAEKAYKEAIAKYPQRINDFPSTYFNLGESLFWQNKHKEALDSYVQFLIRHPEHPYGGYAMTRAGELLDAMGADPTRVVGAYLESYFRYRNNPGSDVARLRMISQQMKGMKEKELKKSIEEMNELQKTSPLPNIKEFIVLIKADGLQSRKDYQAALKDLITYYQGHPTSKKLDLFKSRILRNISEILNQSVQKEDFAETLKTHSKFGKNWLKGNQRLDIPYLLARAYEQAGAFEEARKSYDQIFEKRKSIVGTEDEKERRVNELLPELDSLNLRRAAVSIPERDYPAAYQFLKQIQKKPTLTLTEEAERTQLLAQVLEQQGQLPAAQEQLKKFIDSWQGEAKDILKNQMELAEIGIKLKRSDEVITLTDKIIKVLSESENKSDATIARALELKAQAYQLQNKDLAAIETYQKLLEDYEGKLPLGGVRFKVGEILFKKGDLGGAEKVWNKLDAEKYGLYKKIALERLESSKWQGEHKKYIKRIPAMSNFNGGKE